MQGRLNPNYKMEWIGNPLAMVGRTRAQHPTEICEKYIVKHVKYVRSNIPT